MDNINKISKTFLFVSFLSGIVWLGSYICKILLFYNLFDVELNLRSYINNNNSSGVLSAIYPVITVGLIFFPLFLLTYILFLVISKIKLKMHGWLFIITILIFITAPFEIFLYIKDFKIFNQINYGAFDPNYVFQLIKERIKVLSSFPLIEIFSYGAMLFLIVFKPLEKR